MINEMWAVGFHDRGLGHGDYGVVVKSSNELIFGRVDKELAFHLVEIHNKNVNELHHIIDIQHSSNKFRSLRKKK